MITPVLNTEKYTEMQSNNGTELIGDGEGGPLGKGELQQVVINEGVQEQEDECVIGGPPAPV